jgi:hypothetical protein
MPQDDDECEVIDLSSRRAPPKPLPPPPPEPKPRFTITPDGVYMMNRHQEIKVGTRLPITLHLHRELLQQLDQVASERNRAAKEATGSYPVPRLTRQELIEESCWRVVQDQLSKPPPKKPTTGG